eukprot:CAMPEP_0206489068 /NCGR_PEP_ID=MMETSP0324_2-20121206/42906_1 /ASSEMBLY_ACC=CAM_ASM_000836 /TAXON_ID=2866 /ORGANISM="Crypthecodinium cohnii, Strain Seligo" /LENGTH=51 /DNA_ID=CAMNT_0053968449 /DNA_START=168 /DNA_END=323 /DNA_ORIENTATION=-
MSSRMRSQLFEAFRWGFEGSTRNDPGGNHTSLLSCCPAPASAAPPEDDPWP